MRYDDDRLDTIERKLDDLAARVARLETRAAPASAPSAAASPAPPAPPPPPAATPERARPQEPAPTRPQLDLEDLLGGRVLAWVGGSAILLGIVFFLGMAISRGWIDEPTRTVLAFLGSSALVGLGVWLYERKGRTEAALAAVATGIAGLYATLVVATQVYELVAPEVGLACAAVVGAAATAIAVRWRSTVVAGIGIVGALLAPVLVDAGTSGLSLAFMALALCAAVGVLLWQRWNWLALAAFLVSAPQLVAWLVDANDELDLAYPLWLQLAVLGGFWALYTTAAIGYELRVRSPERLPVASWILLLLNVLLVAGMGYAILADNDHESGAIAWIVVLALGHIALGAFALRQAINREIGSLLVATGLTLSAIAFADALGGPALVAGWAVQAVVLAYLASRSSSAPARLGSDAQRLVLVSAVYLALALVHVLAFEAPLTALRRGVDDLAEAVVSLAVVAGAALAAAWFFRTALADVARILEALGAALLVYLGSVVIVDTIGVYADDSPRQAGQVWLSAYWTSLGLGGIVAGLLRADRRLRLGGLTLLGVAVAKVFLYDLAELDELYRVLSFIALGLVLLAGAFAYQRIRVNVGDREAA